MSNKHKKFSISLSTINILSVVVTAVAALSVCISIFAVMYNRTVMHDARVSSEQAIVQAELAVNSYMDSMHRKLSLIYETIKTSANAAEADNRLSALTTIQDDIYAVTVYGSDGTIVLCTGSGGKLKDKIYNDLSFDKSGFDSSKSFFVSSPHVQTLFEGQYPRVVTAAAASDVPLLGGGKYIAVDFNFSEISRYIDNIGIGRHGYCFVVDKNGEIVYHPQQQFLFSGLKSENISHILTLPDGTTNEKNTVYTVKTANYNLWRIVGISFTDEPASESRTQIAVSIGLSVLICSVIILFVLLLYTKKVSKPVRTLIGGMKKFETDADDFVFTPENESVKELQVLSNSFEHMSGRIQRLLEHIRREEKELRKTELKALQAQINPHFLYNTLDSIQWMCEQGKTDEAARMVSALARLFRISISRGRELIPIRDEMQHAKNYLIIQSYRYRDQFTYEFDINPDIEEYLCNKITVQPLIENAIYHGIDRLIDEGKITISAKTAPDDSNDILITVADNGVGMTDEQCRAVLGKKRSDSHGIGVKNVSDRLKIYFGEKYGITIKSELDAGTEVTVRIPKIKADDTEGLQ